MAPYNVQYTERKGITNEVKIISNTCFRPCEAPLSRLVTSHITKLMHPNKEKYITTILWLTAVISVIMNKKIIP